MLSERKTPQFFFVLILTVLFNLLFSISSQALTINGPNQMSIGETQIFTVEDGNDSCLWGVANGGGSFSGSTGSSVEFTAPISNYYCNNNPTVCVADSEGQVYCTRITINAHTGRDNIAYKVDTPNDFLCNPEYSEYGMYWYQEDKYNCLGEMLSSVYHSSWCYGPRATGNHVCWGSTIYTCDVIQGTHDVRTEAMKAAGCCPAGLGGGSASGSGNSSSNFPGTNNIGSVTPGNNTSGHGNCSTPGTRPGDNSGTGTPNTTVCSEVNLKSGNLYVAKEIAGITLSYNSLDTYNGSLGPKWTHTYDLKLTVLESNATLLLKREDGNVTYFRYSNGIYYPEAISGDNSRIIKNGNNTYTRTFKNGIKQQFDSSGRLTAIIDRNNNTTTLSYGSNNLIITDKNNRTTTITFTDGKITAITDHAGKTYNIGYDTNGMLATISFSGNVLWQYTYDSSGRMTGRKDVPNNWSWTYAYYADGADAGKLHTVTDENGKIREVTYVSSTQTNLKEKDNGIWQYTFDPVYAVKTSITDPLGHTTRYIYDLKRNLTKVISPDKSTINYTYDPNNNLLSVTDASGKTTSYTYTTDFNLVHTMTDPNGHVTQYDYDTNGNLMTITQYGDPNTSDDDAVTTFTYDSKGNVQTITTPQQNKTTHRSTTMTYDTNTNDLLSIDDPDPNKGPVYMTYYPMGNLHTYTDSLNQTTTFTYNDLYQLVNVKDHQQHETNYTYDHRGNLLSVIDANTKPTYYSYNFNNQITTITDALGKNTVLTYSGSGGTGVDKLNSVRDAKNQETTFEYNQAGNLVKETDPLGKSTTYTYDVKNNLATRTDADGRMITYTYYPNNHLWQKLYSGGDTVTYQYDDAGNMTFAANAAITYTMTYDAFNRLQTVASSGAYGRTIEYQYNADSSRTQMKITPDNITYNYAYDDDGNLTTITTPQGNFTFTYDAANRRVTRTAPNGTTSTYSYDTINRLTGIETKQGTTTVDYVNYTQFDNVGNRLTKVSPQESWAYIYDDIYRLTHATPTGGIHQTEIYTYDDVGNRQTSGNQQFPQTNATTVYTYDHEHRLTGVTITQGSNQKILTFAYDPFGRRIKKTIVQDQIGTDCTPPNTCPRTTNYVYDGQNIILEYDQNNNITASYTHGPNIDEPLAVTKGTSTYYYHADGLGSITSLTNADGNVVQTYSYDSFGNITQTGSISQPYAFTGREYDSETGMYFYRARYYDPKVGRFVTKDLIGFAGGDVNLYAYVRNNPVLWIDPSGKVWFFPTGATPVFGVNGGSGPLAAGSPYMLPLEYLPNMHQTAVVHDAIVDALKTDSNLVNAVVNVATMVPAAAAALVYNIATTPYEIYDTIRDMFNKNTPVPVPVPPHPCQK